jgi:hypothetical protein
VLKATLVATIALLANSLAVTPVRAVAASETATYDPVAGTYSYSYTYNLTYPTSSDIPNWTSGWGASGVTGWNYVGSTNNASSVYLGDGYVLTAAHVGAGNFLLDGQTYDAIGGSAESFGTADLTLFKIDTTSTTGTLLDLPALTLQTTTPAVGSSVVMIGYGNGVGEAWALNTISENNQSVSLDNTPYTSTDFSTADSFQEVGGDPDVSMTTDGQLVPGDSGGATFIYNSSTHEWELAGINEVLLEDDSDYDKIDGSGMIQLSDYASSIEADMVPEPPAWPLVLGSVALLAGTREVRRRGLSL